MKSSLQNSKRETLSFLKKAIVIGGIASLLYLLIGILRLPVLLEEWLLPPQNSPDHQVGEIILTLTLLSAGFGLFSFGWWKTFQTRLLGQLQTEDALRESEERYRRLVEMSPDAIAVHIEGKFAYVNPAGVKLLGAKNAEGLLGKSILTIVHPEYHDIVRQRVKSMTEKGQGVPLIEEKFIRLDGTFVDVEVAAIPFTYQGKPAVQVVCRDISERKHSGRIVKEWQERYEKVLSVTGEVVYDWDIEHGKTLWSKTINSVLGYSLNDVHHHAFDWETHIHPEDNERVSDAVVEALANSQYLELEYRLRHKNGHFIPVHDRALIVRDAHGKAVRSLGSLTDITQRLLSEQELKTQFERLQSIYFLTNSLNHAEDIGSIYQEALMAITRTLSTERASILLFDADGVMRFKSWIGISEWYRNQVEGHTPWSPETKEPFPILIADVRNNQSFAQYASIFEKENIVALGFIPLVFQDKLLGKFMVYFDTPHVFTESETQILLTIAGHIAFAIERRRAELELEASEERYRTLSEAAHDAIFIINKNDDVEYVNSFAAQMFQDTPANIIGKPRTTLFPPEISTRQGAVLQKIFETGVPLQSENPLPTKEGVRWHDTYLVPIKNQEGTIVSVLGISRDITERKKTEDALRLSAEQRGLVLRSLPMVFYTTGVSEELPTTWISEQVEQISGFSPKYFIENAKFWESRIHPEDVRHALMNYSDVLKRNTVRTEYRWKCADGSYHWFEDRTVLIRDEQGKPKEIIGIWLDITNQKQAEESVRESEAKWRTLMESSPGLVHEIDRNGKILYINRATLGYERESVIGSRIYDYVSSETATFMHQQVEEVFEKKHSVWFEVPAAGPYGSEAWYTCIIGPIFKDGEVVSAIMDSIDITEHKHREHLQNTGHRVIVWVKSE